MFQPQYAHQDSMTSTSGKCYPLFIGGSSLKDGMTQGSVAPMSCSALRCMDCDKRVIRYADNCKWAEHVDYIFVRNYNTLPEKLKGGLEPAPGFAAYACQCKFIALADPAKKVEDTPFKWHCRGH